MAWSFDPSLMRCPRSVVGIEDEMHVGWWRRWKSLGLLPFDGDLGDQPDWVVDLLEVADGTWRTIESKRDAANHEALMKSIERKQKG